MKALDPVAWEILNATADDCENLEQIYHQVRFDYVGAEGMYRPRQGAPCLAEVAAGVKQLVEAGLLVVSDDEGRASGDPREVEYLYHGWFRMTDEGKAVWKAESVTGTSNGEATT